MNCVISSARQTLDVLLSQLLYFDSGLQYDVVFVRVRAIPMEIASSWSLNRDINKETMFWETINGVSCSRGAIAVVPTRIVYFGNIFLAFSIPI